MKLNALAPGKHSRKAIYGAVVAFFGTLVVAVKSGGIDFTESVLLVGNTVVAYLAVWAGVNEPRP